MPPKTGRHANKTAWVAHKHQPSLAVTEDKITGWDDTCCEKCVEVLEWRRKYGKYKMLTTMGRCNLCKGKVVKVAYHQVCQPCAGERKVCAKCMMPYEVPQEELELARRERELRKIIVNLPERYRRSAERKLAKEEIDLDAVEAIVRKATNKRIAPSGRPGKDSDTDEEDGEEEGTPAKRAKHTPVTTPAPAPAKPDATMAENDDSDSDEIM